MQKICYICQVKLKTELQDILNKFLSIKIVDIGFLHLEINFGMTWFEKFQTFRMEIDNFVKYLQRSDKFFALI